MKIGGVCGTILKSKKMKLVTEMNIKITDVRCRKGDAAFLIDDGKTSILYDTGFGFTGFAIADKVKAVLGDRKLDYIFLSHSHYDHALGAPYVVKVKKITLRIARGL